MSARDVTRVLRRVGSGVASGEVHRVDPCGARLLLKALLFEGAGVPAWHALAACSGLDERLFFPGVGPDTHLRVSEAKGVCAGCPVRRECLEDAMSWEMPSTRAGVVGGLTAADRERLHA
ncbi:MAG: WhiB family transcriptional regulator, partial [Pseudonocardiaceae bacterium]